MIEKIQERVRLQKNKKLKFRYNGSRNQIQEFEGKITKCYKNLFLIEGEKFIKTYTYSDILTGLLEINIK